MCTETDALHQECCFESRSLSSHPHPHTLTHSLEAPAAAPPTRIRLSFHPCFYCRILILILVVVAGRLAESESRESKRERLQAKKREGERETRAGVRILDPLFRRPFPASLLILPTFLLTYYESPSLPPALDCLFTASAVAAALL